MDFLPITTRPMVPPQDDLFALLDEVLPPLKERDILLVTSKIVAIHQGRCLPVDQVPDKDELIEQEAEWFVPRSAVPNSYATITIKGHTLISSAGIDQSNGSGYYVLWPNDPVGAAKEIWAYLRAKFALTELGVILTDSHSIPQRRGAMGISIGAYGMQPLKDYRGTPDIFGRPLLAEQANLVDALAAAGVLVMGEAAEQRPLLLIRDAAMIEFTDQPTYHDLVVDRDDDIFAPLYQAFQRGGQKE